MSKLDLLAIGDVASSQFIRLKDADITCDINHEHCQICFNFGDKIPYEAEEIVAAGGSAPNAAVASVRLNLGAGIVTDIGGDESGAACRSVFERERVQTHISVHDGMETNQHYVLWYRDERTTLVHHIEYPYRLPELPDASWIFVGSIGESSAYHAEIVEYLKKNQEAKLAFQPGTFQIKTGVARLEYFYRRADILALTILEARKIVGGNLLPADLLRELSELGSPLVLMTDGRRGAYLADGSNLWHLPIFPDKKPPFERSGAGDATVSTMVSFLHLGLSPIESLKRGLINAASVVQEVGPQKGLMTRDAIEAALREAPAEFAPEKIG